MKKIILILLSCFCQFAAAEKVVIVGDSLTCGSFGKNLFQLLSLAGNEVTLFCSVSSTPSSWIKGKNPKGQSCKTMTTSEPSLKLCNNTGQIPKFEEILKTNLGARFIVAHGTNSLLSPKVDAYYGSLAKLINDAGLECDWIGPPNMNPAQSKGFPEGRIDTLQKNLTNFYTSLNIVSTNGCSLIDSREATAVETAGNQTVDGVHRNEAAGKYWAQSIFEFL